MVLEQYPNIAAVGLIKNAALNKKRYAKLEETLNRASAAELSAIDNELPNAPRVNGLVLTSAAILKLEGLGKNKKIAAILLNRDLVYVWGSVTTMRMNFIPYEKSHVVHMIGREGTAISTDPASTFILSKKEVIGPITESIRNVVEPHYPGVLYGYSKEREQAMAQDFGVLVQAVDQQRAEALQNK